MCVTYFFPNLLSLSLLFMVFLPCRNVFNIVEFILLYFNGLWILGFPNYRIILKFFIFYSNVFIIMNSHINVDFLSSVLIFCWEWILFIVLFFWRRPREFQNEIIVSMLVIKESWGMDTSSTRRQGTFKVVIVWTVFIGWWYCLAEPKMIDSKGVVCENLYSSLIF